MDGDQAGVASKIDCVSASVSWYIKMEDNIVLCDFTCKKCHDCMCNKGYEEGTGLCLKCSCHFYNKGLFKVNRYTRAPKFGGKQIRCGFCEAYITVYHFNWIGIECCCGRMVKKNELFH